jgi:hypothetical protein
VPLSFLSNVGQKSATLFTAELPLGAQAAQR